LKGLCTLLYSFLIYYYQGFDHFNRVRPLKKRCRILPAGGSGGVPQLQNSPKIGGYRGLIETIAAVSYHLPEYVPSRKTGKHDLIYLQLY
jgi:hypothetical protein